MRFAHSALRTRLPQSSALILSALLLTTGCASHAELPPQVTQDLVDLRDHMIRGKAQVQTTSNAARDLTTRPQSALQPQVDRLLREIDNLNQLASTSRGQFSAAQQNAQVYFAQWDQELATMSDSLAKSGQQRRAESQASLETLRNRVNDLKAEFRPFLANLDEVGRYLRLDPTPSGVSTVKGRINSTLENEKSIMSKADSVIAQIDAMRGGK